MRYLWFSFIFIFNGGFTIKVVCGKLATETFEKLIRIKHPSSYENIETFHIIDKIKVERIPTTVNPIVKWMFLIYYSLNLVDNPPPSSFFHINFTVVGVEQVLSLSCNSTERESVLHRLRVTPLSFCLRLIVNENPQNLEKTTSSVLSVILIYLWMD